MEAPWLARRRVANYFSLTMAGVYAWHNQLKGVVSRGLYL